MNHQNQKKGEYNMNLNKVTCTIAVEVLAPEVIPHLLHVVSEHLEQGTMNGKLEYTDGDSVKWSTNTSKTVEV